VPRLFLPGAFSVTLEGLLERVDAEVEHFGLRAPLVNQTGF
jgi:hypothetical protein